jgi:hypothetical protein
MTTTTVTDCLVLKISEYLTDNEPDNVLYVFYDKMLHHFFIRGAQSSARFEFYPYSFRCEFAKDLEQFIHAIISSDSKVVYELLNYTDLPVESDDITYEYLEEAETPMMQITTIVSKNYNSKGVVNLLRMLRNVFNYY